MSEPVEQTSSQDATQGSHRPHWTLEAKITACPGNLQEAALAASRPGAANQGFTRSGAAGRGRVVARGHGLR